MVTRSNGTSMLRVYDTAGQLLQQKEIVIETGEVISQFDFEYDAVGNIIKEKTTLEPDIDINLAMTYAEANRLATYDGSGIQLDADGNMTNGPLSGNMANFSFDSRNRLTNAGETVYHYDAENQRIGVNQIQYVINSQPVLSQVLVRTKGNGEVTYYVYGLGLIGEANAGNYFSYHYDLRGSTIALTDEAGQVIERFQYSPYGMLLSGDASTTPFLFNGKYGVMTDTSGLYYMRARFYSPEIRRFVNQDILLGSIDDGQTLNRYAYVTGQPISFIDPFGLFGWEDGLSLILDLLPFVGSCKGGIEFFIGSDPITGESIPRLESLVGIIPGVKYVTKSGKIGEAVVYLYKSEDRHFSIVVKRGDESLHTEQVVTSTFPDGKPKDTIIDVFTDDGTPIRNIFEFDLPDADSAQKFQKSLFDKDTGIYNVDGNSCLSHVCDTLRAGGVDAPSPDGSEKWKKEAYEFLLKNRKKR
jgi:RHS repeat-associated protein